MLRAQRHSNADFLPTLYYVIRKHAIDSDRGEQHRDRGEARKEPHRGAVRGHRLINYFVHGAYMLDDLHTIESVDHIFRGLGLHLGIAAASHGHKNVRMNRRTAALGHRCVTLSAALLPPVTFL